MSPDEPPGSVESLYPFLYPDTTSPTNTTNTAGTANPALDSVLAEVRRSTTEKAAEIVALRESLAARYGDALSGCAARLAECFAGGGQLFAFGNGGSSTDADALAQLFQHPPPPGRPLRATSLARDVAVLTALANDVGFEVVFSRQLAAFGGAGDIAVGLSTSGGSANVLRALAEARRLGMVTVGFAGYGGGKMAESGTVDHLFVVSSASVHRIQEAQTTLYHVLWELTLRTLAR